MNYSCSYDNFDIDSDILDWLSKNTTLSLSHTWEEDKGAYWVIHKQRGTWDDLEFDIIAEGSTPKESLDKARKYLNKKVDK